MSVTIYHNPRCSASRGALRLIEERGIEPRIVLYLEAPLEAEQIRLLLKKLGIAARDLLRTREPEYEQLGLHDPAATDDEIVAAIVRHPILFQRPVVVNGRKAVLARPPERVLEVL